MTTGKHVLDGQHPPRSTRSRSKKLKSPGPSCEVRFTGESQRGYGPEMWGITLEQLRGVKTAPGYCLPSTWYDKGMTMRDVVEQIIKPQTAGQGMGYALFLNFAKPLRARVMISHAWDESYEGVINALAHSGVKGPFWICAMAIYQPEDLPEVTIARQLGPSPRRGPFATVLRQASQMLCLLTELCNIYTRMWCVYEMFVAMEFGVQVRMVQSFAYSARLGVVDALYEQCSRPVRSQEARCGNPASPINNDERAIRREIESSSSYEAVNRAVEEARLQALLEYRHNPRVRMYMNAPRCNVFHERYDDRIASVRHWISCLTASPTYMKGDEVFLLDHSRNRWVEAVVESTSVNDLSAPKGAVKVSWRKLTCTDVEERRGIEMESKEEWEVQREDREEDGKADGEPCERWVAPDQASTLLRKKTTADVSKLCCVEGIHQAGATVKKSRSAVSASKKTTFCDDGCSSDDRPVMTRSATMPVFGRTNSLTRVAGRSLCKHGCGRRVMCGLTRGLASYDTCCRLCAKTQGSGGHDQNCGGSRRFTRENSKLLSPVRVRHEDGEISGVAAAESAADASPKIRLARVIADPQELNRCVNEAFGCMAPEQRMMDLRREEGIALAERLLLSLCGARLTVPAASVEIFFSEGQSINAIDFCRDVVVRAFDAVFPRMLALKAPSVLLRGERRQEDFYSRGIKLGEGSFGSVFEVQHRVSRETRDCKFISESRSGIIQEIQCMMDMDHCNIIKVYEYFVDRGKISLITEECNGMVLHDRIESVFLRGQPHYGVAFTRNVMKQILRAIAYMHSVRFAHKDVKPQTIGAIDTDGSSIKFIDLSIAELLRPEQAFVQFPTVGTLPYIAPEAFSGKMALGGDVWSAGVVLYSLLTGGLPFCDEREERSLALNEASWEARTISRICNEQPLVRPGLVSASPSCRDLLERMLDKDPNQRPNASWCLQHAWFTSPELEHNENEKHELDSSIPSLSAGVVQCLEAFSHQSELKQLFFCLISQLSADPALVELRTIFTHFDINNNGALENQVVLRILLESGLPWLTAERIVHALDRNKDGRVTWSEFVAAARCANVCQKTHLVDAAFDALDADGDDLISAKDCERVLALGDGDNEATTQRYVSTLFIEAKKSISGMDACEGQKAATGELDTFPLLVTVAIGKTTDLRKHQTLTSAEDFLAAPATTFAPSLTRDEFRSFVGQRMEHQEGGSIYAVS
eukprot:TRINITY_DN63489_c0_g1_i1.p1 TRINITY_DN63489_c0_g1~~TRINITY_DN63489_c0_g1_i1.p1  ORF type:complete len:1214 (+),score=137.61 TRINITY_DN63489_c0_g1_i1:164-3805(+)